MFRSLIRILCSLRLRHLDLDYYANNLRISVSTISRFICCCSVPTVSGRARRIYIKLIYYEQSAFSDFAICTVWTTLILIGFISAIVFRVKNSKKMQNIYIHIVICMFFSNSFGYTLCQQIKASPILSFKNRQFLKEHNFVIKINNNDSS